MSPGRKAGREAQFGWRGACFGWAALHIFLALPLNWLLPQAASASGVESEPKVGVGQGSNASSPLSASLLLAVVFAITWFISTAMAAHLPPLLMAGGAPLGAAVAFGALVGPAQVGGRILEFSALRKVHPLLSARLAALMHPAGAALLALAGAPIAAVFVISQMSVFLGLSVRLESRQIGCRIESVNAPSPRSSV